MTDGQNKALMQNCKGFLHPAVFEGFGIPPLEALSLGAPIALARASCLPELYGDTARYFDPYDYDVDLDALFAKPAAPPDQSAGQVQLGENRTVLAGRDQKVRGSVRAVGTAPEK